MGKAIEKPKITLDIRGRLLTFCTMVNGEPTGEAQTKFDWGNAVFDALSVSGLTFVSTLGAVVSLGAPEIAALKAAALAAASQFFMFISIKRGLIKNGDKKTT